MQRTYSCFQDECESGIPTEERKSLIRPPREIPAMAPELLTVILTSVSCVAFCLVILMLVVVLYRKDPLCCRFRPYTAEHHTDELPHYNSRHTLVGTGYDEHSAAMNQAAVGPQAPGRLFIIGKPNDYHMEGPLPRLPSYESVRRKDRQRQIHSMIAQRFGLFGCHDEPPPAYEESLPQCLRSVDVHSQDERSNLSEDTHSLS
ncbi:uncharacterized protein [Paralichthys olivaceus]|uniref:uncharacterized protein n=1 Tax=Paralichthys olivaceus TaxID=8255 RepID=UPI00097DB3B8|nr:PREDICTED: uncharacterized protein LOC109626745 [Paralichthys olivaceus]